MENVKSKPFFVINNTYASNFTLHDILFILESFVLFAKRLLYQNFSYSNIWEVSYVIYFFQFLKSFPDGDYLVKTMETWVCEICKICMKTSELNVFKVNNKSTRTRCCSGVFMINFRGVGIEDPVTLYVGVFFAIQGTKAKLFNRF